MQLRRFDDVARFNVQVSPFLLRHEAEHNLPFGILSTLLTTDTYQHPPYLACVEDQGSIVGVAILTPPYSLILSTVMDEAALPLVAADLYTFYPEVRGVIGAKAISKAFAEHWRTITSKSPRLNMQERIYKLERVIPVSGVSGELRPASAADYTLLVEWMLAFYAESLEAVTQEFAERAVDIRLDTAPNIRGLRLWWDAGEPVSMAGYAGPTPNGIRIGPVYTPPQHRKWGYASACVAALTQEMLNAGRKFVFLFTDLTNPTSNHIYQEIGYQPVCDVDEYRFDA